MGSTPWQLFEGWIVDARYRLRTFVGEGGFGAVFLADETVGGRRLREVAIKLIRPHSQISRDRQFEELHHSVNLDHPHVLRCHTAGECRVAGMGLFYLAMEPAQGSLADRMAAGALTTAEVREVAEHVASALQYLHASPRHMVHRDVKPGNVMRVGDRWKLGDFGISRALGPASQVQSIAAGTPHYMPPEAFHGEISPEWDVWSLGILIAETLTGGTVDPDQIRQDPSGAMPAIWARLSPPFDALVRGCLQWERRARWSASRVCAELAARPTDPDAAACTMVGGEAGAQTGSAGWAARPRRMFLPGYSIGKYQMAAAQYRLFGAGDGHLMDATA